jgi:hypothetical protein
MGVSVRTLITLVANAVAWGLLLQWPWEQLLGPAMIALGAIHLVYPFIAPSRVVPLLVAALDAAALYAAWIRDAWDDMTIIFVPMLAAASILALAYAASVVMLLHGRAARRELARRDDQDAKR